MMDSNAQKAVRESEPDAKVLAAYWGDALNANETRLLGCAADSRLADVITYFSTPNRSLVHLPTRVREGTNSTAWTTYYVVRQQDRRHVRNAEVFRVDPKDSDHNLVFAHVRLGGRVTPNRHRIEISSGQPNTSLVRLKRQPEQRVPGKGLSCCSLFPEGPGCNYLG